MSRILVDTSALPILRVVFEGTVDDDAFETYLAEYQKLFTRTEKYAAVFDALNAGTTPANQRRRQAKWMHDHRSDIRRLCVGGAFVLKSPVVRATLSAILWMQPLPFEHHITRDLDDAMRWAQRRLRLTGAASSVTSV